MTTSWPKRLAFNLLVAVFLPLFLVAALLPSRRRTLLVWGSAPLKANHYWSEALRRKGLPSVTIMGNLFGINRRADFDRYFEDFAPRGLPRALRFAIGSCVAVLYILRRGAVLHTSYWGFALTLSAFWPLESLLLRLAGIRTVIIPFGADAYLYSQVIDTSLRQGLLSTYPHLARSESLTRRRVEHWNRHADVVIATLMVDGLGRWDVTANQIFAIDTDAWSPSRDYSQNDGSNGPVRVIHTPNHRGFKGTEFVINAIERLRTDGLQVELMLIENVPNDEVRGLLASADILAEQFLATGYAMSGIEGMACGLPVLSNLENEAYTRVFRRYGFLDECPILSTTPETLHRNLRRLVENPALRQTLGRAGRAYVEKYHSYAMAQYLFGAIHDHLLRGEQIDLINLFHPLKSAFNCARPTVTHPLVDSQLPDVRDRTC